MNSGFACQNRIMPSARRLRRVGGPASTPTAGLTDSLKGLPIGCLVQPCGNPWFSATRLGARPGFACERIPRPSPSVAIMTVSVAGGFEATGFAPSQNLHGSSSTLGGGSSFSGLRGQSRMKLPILFSYSKQIGRRRHQVRKPSAAKAKPNNAKVPGSGVAETESIPMGMLTARVSPSTAFESSTSKLNP